MGEVAAVVRVTGGARRRVTQEVAGGDDLRGGAADALPGALAEGVDAARPEVADGAAQAQRAEPALRLLRLEAVPHDGDAALLHLPRHAAGGGVHGRHGL